MSFLQTIGRVVVALLGFVLMAVSTTGSGFQTSQLCAKEGGDCVEEIESSCLLNDEVKIDAIWVED